MRLLCVVPTLLLPLALEATSPAGLEAQPFAPRSAAVGATLFHPVPATETGLLTQNNYADPQMWAGRLRELELGAVGTGVAIADFDGDGRPDIFVVSKTESCRLFRNLGSWKFEDVTEKAGVADLGAAAGIWKQGATFTDVNNDGRPDLYVCRFGAPNLLYVNQGDSTFKEEAAARGLDVNDSSVMAAFCDYDRDGWLDVYVQTNLLDIVKQPQGRRDYLFHSNRDGTFTDVTDRAGISGLTQGHSATWWDYDNDGWPDLYVANDFAPVDTLYRNNRDLTFTNVLDAVVPYAPRSSMGSDLGDVDNDGRVDLLVADMAASTHVKDQRTMAPLRNNTLDPAAGKLAGYNRNTLFLNTGTGRCLEAAFLAGLAATDWTWSVRFEDLDQDGRLDLHVTNGMFREPHNADLVSRQAAAQNFAEVIQIEKNSPVLNEANLAYRNLGDLRFENVSAAWGLNELGVSFGAAFGDLDGDGDLDVVYTNYQKGITVLRNDTDRGRSVIFALRGLSTPVQALSPSMGTRSNRLGVGATVRIETAAGPQVRQLVLARGVLSSSEPVLHFGLGDARKILRVTVEWPGGARQEFTDLPAGCKYTITEPSDTPPASTPTKTAATLFTALDAAAGFSHLIRESPVDELSSQPLLPQRQNRRGPSLAVGDLAGRGQDDVVLGGSPLDSARVLLADGSGHLSPARTGGLSGTAPLNDGPVLIFDADGDGTNDVLLTKGGNNPSAGLLEFQPRLFLNTGAAALHPAPAGALPEWPQSIGALAAADFDRDGRLDVFLGSRLIPGAYPSTPTSALWANRGGRFEDVTEALAPALREPGMVTAVLWSDADGDGWPDLVVALDWGPVKFFHNEQGRGFADWSDRAGFTAAGCGWWTALATADFNGDGRPDYAVGNLGLNTPYRTDAAQPVVLFSGDFKGDDSNQLIEAYTENGALYPRRSRLALGAAVPTILKRYPRNDTFARAPLADIVGADKLAKAQRFAATELRSGVFLSQPDGAGVKYIFYPLPHLAQIAPVQGLAAGDFDGDGKSDLYCLHNSYAPIPSVGRFAGGLSQLLRGDGHGGFAPVPPAESNLLVPGDAKALAVTDLDENGWPDFLVTRNNDTTLAFRHNGVSGRHSLAVNLQGPLGNPAAIGARLTLTLADGSAQSAEIGAGAGYYSQSTATIFFGWPDGNPPARLTVRWPDGKVTQHAVPAEKPRLRLTLTDGK